jgi:hypothetical protein
MAKIIKTCATCAKWKKAGNLSFGNCFGTEIGKDIFIPNRRLQTAADFGCIKHILKKEEAQDVEVTDNVADN